jgi:two-component system cell cycle sensor histidine kinase/response regulator CckA
MSTPLRVLTVEDSEDDHSLLVRALIRGGFDVICKRVDTADTLRVSLNQEEWDIVISDYAMPQFNGAEALEIVRERDPDLPLIFLSGTIGEQMAIDAMRVGARDYVMKGDLGRLIPAIHRELQEAEMRRDHRRAEQRLRQLEKFEAIGKLAGGIAHDFNNVIGAILGWAELGSEQVPKGSRAAEYFDNISRQSERAAALTRQLLAYARRQILEPRNVDLNEIVSETTALLQKVIGAHIEVKIVLAPDLQVTRADPSQIEQVLLNLCFNARDAMPKGGQLLIETRNFDMTGDYCRRHVHARPGRYIQLSVSDTGIGMDAATQDRIFEPFFTTKEVGKGTGLGLATAFGVVKQHEGLIDVYSELGKGTNFHVYLPMSGGVPEPLEREDEVPVRGGTETILVADDHEGLRSTFKETLEGLGYRVLLAVDGEQAVQTFIVNYENISLALLDAVMPKLNGLDTYAQLCRTKPGIPVIFTSGYSEQGELLASMITRGAVFLQKPFGPKLLARKIRELLDRPRD